MNDKLYKLMDWPAIEAVVYSEEDNPHHILGPHVRGNNVLVQTFQPGAIGVRLQVKDGKSYKMEQADENGYFVCLLPGKKIPEYTYLIKESNGKEVEKQDAYRFAPIIEKKDTKRFNNGIHYEAYQILGAHYKEVDGVWGVHFAVWAPNAVRVSVVGDFNAWDGRVHQMRRLWDSGIFELFIPGVECGSIYKYELKVKGGLTYLKADPYAFGQQLRPDTASVVRKIDQFAWEDETWIAKRKEVQGAGSPISVYEVHLASFQKPQVTEDEKDLAHASGFYNYRELAPRLIAYVKEMGYTHVELMPVMEHPLDASWGYQVIGYYAPTSRYGTPEDFMYFVNELHKAGIGVILDWVPAHFPKDTYGLSGFDGTCLYEHQDPRLGEHPHWGTLIYNYGRPEVSNYLIANALYWVEQYHADGIRMDAVASMLYLDYGKNDGEWIANIYGGNENLDAVEFLKHLNSVLHSRNPGAITIAEESTAWPKVTGDLKDNSLGFDFKWNMGWMNDYLQYIRFDPYFRAHHHNELTFSMIYAYSEKFMLVFSHDEVVHGKATLIGKMPGNRSEQFANLRATYAYMMLHPGKKLLFMGQDMAEYDEWNENRELEWNLLEVPEHKKLNDMVRSLNQFYKKHPSLYALDDQAEGFEWINNMNAEHCTLSFLRKADNNEDMLLVVVNFANVERKGYRVGVPFEGKYKEIWNSDSVEFGGTGVVNKKQCDSDVMEWDGRENSMSFDLGPLSVAVFTCVPYTEEEKKEMVLRAAIKEKEEALKLAKKAEERAKKAEAELEAVRRKKGVKRKKTDRR